MPARLDELEKRVAELETRPKAIASPKDPCTLCGSEFKTTDVRPDPTFGRMGVKIHTKVCDNCGHKEDFQIKP